jgi:hypothetical protein
MLVTPFALVTPQIGIDRCGPLMTVVVPWDILQASSRSRKTCSRVGTGILWPCAVFCVVPLASAYPQPCGEGNT